MKVLHTEWSDGWGGQEIRIISEMEILREMGVELTLATRENAKIKKEAQKKGFKVYTLPFNGKFDFKTFFSLKNIIKKENIDIVNTHSGKDTWVGGLAAKTSKIKFIRTRHLSNPINPSRINFINELADFIITTGSGVREAMIKNNRIKPNKIISIPTGVDENIFNPKKYNKTEIRKKFFMNEKIAVGFLGVLRNVKRPDIFVKIAKYFPEVDFFIAGDGPKKENLKKLVNDLKLQNVKFLGHIEKPAEFLAAIDILLLTSENEGVPQSVIQGLMMNKEIIASNVGSVKDLYYKNNFLLVKPKEEEFVKNLKKLLNKEIKINFNREFVVNNFSKKSMGEKVLKVYEEVLK